MKPLSRILMVGASSGIGYHTAVQLCDQGHIVYNAARTACPDSRVHNLTADVTDPLALDRAVQAMVAVDGGIDALIYSAGVSMAAPVETARAEDYRYLFEVNFFGALQAAQSVLPYMRTQNSGRIVFVGSLGGTLPIAFDAFYSASKAALELMTQALRLEVAPYSIGVTNVLPGGTATRFTFKRKVYPSAEAGAYAPALKKAVRALADLEQGGMPPQAVAETICRVLQDDHPPAHVSVGLKNKTILLSQKILPMRLTEHLNGRQYLQ